LKKTERKKSIQERLIIDISVFLKIEKINPH